ncbi:MAG: mqnB [Mucilaginibacter sp.]|nr:mqnB [Mucilaginibacter sp.]
MFYLSPQIKSDMRVLVVCATEEEVRSLKSEVLSQTPDSRLWAQDLKFLITGVGMTATAFALGRHLANSQYDLAINLGIAGSFDRSFALGDVVEITEDTFAELGAEDGDEFISIEKLGFGTNTYTSTAKLSGYYNNSSIKQATAITVNTVNGNDASIKKVTGRLTPQVESMEGAAFFYACREMNVPCLQIRAVSNYVEKRNRDNWKIGLAIKNLNTFALKFLKGL